MANSLANTIAVDACTEWIYAYFTTEVLLQSQRVAAIRKKRAIINATLEFAPRRHSARIAQLVMITSLWSSACPVFLKLISFSSTLQWRTLHQNSGDAFQFLKANCTMITQTEGKSRARSQRTHNNGQTRVEWDYSMRPTFKSEHFFYNGRNTIDRAQIDFFHRVKRCRLETASSNLNVNTSVIGVHSQRRIVYSHLD